MLVLLLLLLYQLSPSSSSDVVQGFGLEAPRGQKWKSWSWKKGLITSLSSSHQNWNCKMIRVKINYNACSSLPPLADVGVLKFSFDTLSVACQSYCCYLDIIQCILKCISVQ